MTLFHSRLFHANNAILGVFALLSLAIDAASAKAQPASVVGQQLINALPAQNIVWLDNEKTAIGRYDTAIDPFQVVIFAFSEQDQRVDSPGLISAMHNQLPLMGWSILSIGLPNKEPVRETSEGAAEENDTANTAFAIQQVSTDKINLAVDYLKSQQTQSVAIFASNKRVREAFNSSIKHKDFVSGLILWQVDEVRFSPEDLNKLKESKVSILDIAPSSLNNTQLALRKKHFAQAGIQQHYRLITLPDSAPADSSVKRIRHWLKKEFKP